MAKFIDDLAGAIFDVLKLIAYFFAGVFLVGVPLYSIAKIFEWFFN